MIKKIIAVIAALAMCVPIIAHAAPEYHYGDAVLKDGTITIYGLSELDSETEAVILVGYDENGVLVGAQYLAVENDECTGREIVGAARYKMTRVTGFETGFTNLNVITETGQSEPAVSYVPTAEPTTTPAATDASDYPKLAATPPPPPYERSLDSYYTFSVIKSVSAATGDNGPEYLVEVLREGNEEQLHVSTDVKIAVSSDYYSDLTGADASALTEGDLVYFERNLAGTKITNMAFIYRPVKENIITSTQNYGTNFERLFSTGGRVYASPANEAGTVIGYGAKEGKNRYQYAFGAVLEKGNGYFTLINRSGISDNAIEVATTRDTIVYTCDISARRDRLDISTPAAIVASGIPKSEYKDGGVITFSDDWDYAYAFARIINGVATEIVIYTGYGA